MASSSQLMQSPPPPSETAGRHTLCLSVPLCPTGHPENELRAPARDGSWIKGGSMGMSFEVEPRPEGGNGGRIGTALGEKARPRIASTAPYQQIADEDRGT